MKNLQTFEAFVNENLNEQSRKEIEDKIEELESKIWELDNANKSWIPSSNSEKEKMRKTFQSKIDKLKKKL
jgi:hypothetical protein